MAKTGPKARLLVDRFWEKVSPEPNTGCWLWLREAMRRHRAKKQENTHA